jgi:hypothetical protein
MYVTSFDITAGTPTVIGRPFAFPFHLMTTRFGSQQHVLNFLLVILSHNHRLQLFGQPAQTRYINQH